MRTSLLTAILWITIPAALGSTDVYIDCPTGEWQIGSRVTLKCSVQNTKYPAQCGSPTSNDVQFRRSPNGAAYTSTCSLADVTNTCTSSSSSECSCSTHNATHYNFQYTFTVASDSSGYWDCSVPCFNGLVPVLNSSTSDGCKNKTVKASPCDGVDCKHGTTCHVSNGQPQCNCTGTVYKGTRCEESACDDHEGKADCVVSISHPGTAFYICDSFKEGSNCEATTPCAHAVIAESIILLILLVAIFIFIAFIIHKRLTITICLTCPSHLVKTLRSPQEVKTSVEEFIKKTVGWCTSCMVTVNITRNGLIIVEISFRAISVLSLKELQEVMEHINLFNETSDKEAKPHEPAVDYPRPMPYPKYTGQGNSERQKKKKSKEVALSNVRESSPPSDTSSNDKAPMIPSTKERPVLITPGLTSAGIGNSASPRLEPLQSHSSRMTSVERNSGAFALAPIPSGKST